MPRSLHAQITRKAISPRLAIRIFSNILAGTDGEQRLSVLDGPAVLDKFRRHDTGHLRFDLVHEFHRLYDAEHLARLNRIADTYEGRRARGRRFVERPDDGGPDQHLAGLLFELRSSCDARGRRVRRRAWVVRIGGRPGHRLRSSRRGGWGRGGGGGRAGGLMDEGPPPGGGGETA